MHNLRRNLLVAALSLGLLAFLLVLVALSNYVAEERPETLVFRELVLATPPPPPPPPPSNSSAASAAPVNLSLANPESPVQMLNLDLQLDLPKGQLLTTGNGEWNNGTGNGIELAIDWSGFSLSELDGYPIVLQAPTFNFPRRLLERGIQRVDVRLHILIDETGQPYLMDMVETADVDIKSDIEKWIEGVRFSPPTVSGVVVRAEFAWPVVLTAK